ncbi:protein kinase C epsilon type-like, partial [Ictalurus furcatus]|uniref:protein kinase C epsilon type-like n=1 Tax=Ictalurus furcatus TaxID=66913 RepID=UPI002350B671
KNPEDFNFLSVLERGRFGKVILSELSGTNEAYTLKMMKKDRILAHDIVNITLTERRILVLPSKHPYLTHLFCSFQTTENVCFVMEYVNGGDLSHHIARSRGFDEHRSQFYAAEITCALMFLHHNGIVHRYLKPENILLDADGHCKLADFGLCKETFEDVEMTFCGTPNYMAPKLIQGLKCSTSVYWWALGVIMFEMMTGCKPFVIENLWNLFDSIKHDKLKYPSKLSRKAVSILKAFLKKDPKTRLGCVKSRRGWEEAIKVHPYFKSINWLLLEQRKVTPPFKPLIIAKRDVDNFNHVFTCEDLKLSRVNNDVTDEFSQEMFQGFSFVNNMY